MDGKAKKLQPPATGAMADDPHAWLEEVEGEAQLEWVRERNAHAQQVFETSRFEELRREILEVLDASDKIPEVVKHGEYLYNFWTDAQHQRGIFRRTTPASYASPEPEWELLLDVDALAEQEGVNWVCQSTQLLPHDYQRALIRLSRGGADAHVTREFDMSSLSWVEDGFNHPESKGLVTWADETGDTVLCATESGPASLTTSGYPRTLRLWRRGTPVAQALELFTAEPTDMGVWADHDFTPGHERTVIMRKTGFYQGDFYLLDEDNTPRRLEVPQSSEPRLHRQWLALELRDPWDIGGTTHAAGSLIAIELDRFLAGERDFRTLFAPTDSTSLAQVVATRNHFVLNVLDDVKSRLEVHTHAGDGWRRRALPVEAAGDEPLDMSIRAVDAENEDALWLNLTGFLTPTTLARVDLDAEAAGTLTPMKSTPSYFEASGMRATQQFATSDDGTRVPYFQVTPLEAKGQASPTLLYGYGGFEIPLLPSYSGVVGRAWLARGGVFVMANIRGGGEYGPRWHQAALREKRHRAYEDFAAVARDLVARGVTEPGQLGMRGGSNGGLLIGNMLMGYPELFAAAVCQVPLLDMKRYSKLLAGASWMAEYGDPDKAEEWEFIRTFSPYHLYHREQRYPPVLFTTSTRDDRVHPGHARKMAAMMLEAGDDVTYYENIEGGHGGAATNQQAALMQAMIYEFLWQRLGS